MLSKYSFLEAAAVGIDRPIDTHIAYFESIDKKDEADANAVAPSEDAAMSVRIGKRDFFYRPHAQSTFLPKKWKFWNQQTLEKTPLPRVYLSVGILVLAHFLLQIEG